MSPRPATGLTGWKRARRGNFDLIITDYMMPVMLGPEFCRELRKDILLTHIPIIMLTGKGDTKDMVTGINAGADDYLVKPFEPETLLARIAMIVKRTVRNLDANPLTTFPGTPPSWRNSRPLCRREDYFAVGYCDLDKFKIYNDKYGFERATRPSRRPRAS